MVAGRQPVDDRHLRLLGELCDHVVRASPHDDRVHVAREHARGIPHRLPSSQLELLAAQDQGRAAELGHPDLERDARAGRRLLEHQRDAPAGQRVGAHAVSAPRLQLERSVQQGAQLSLRELLAREEVTDHEKRKMVWHHPWRSAP